MNPDEAIEKDADLFEPYLDELGVTLWQNWDLTDPRRKRQAAVWFVTEFRRFKQWQAAKEKAQCAECQ